MLVLLIAEIFINGRVIDWIIVKPRHNFPFGGEVSPAQLNPRRVFDLVTFTFLQLAPWPLRLVFILLLRAHQINPPVVGVERARPLIRVAGLVRGQVLRGETFYAALLCDGNVAGSLARGSRLCDVGQDTAGARGFLLNIAAHRFILLFIW